MSFVRIVRALAAFVALLFLAAAAFGSGEKAVSNRNAKKIAPATPLAIYQKQVRDEIGPRWYAYTKARADMLTVGKVELKFRILADGRITGLKILSNTSNEAFANVCLQSVLEAKFPPIPEAVRRQLGHDFLDWDPMDFVMYPD